MARLAGVRLRAASILAALLVALLAMVAPGPAAAAGRAPSIGAPSAIVVDARTGERLYGRAPTARRSIASTTKLMTAFITLERARQRQVFTSPGYPPAARASRRSGCARASACRCTISCAPCCCRAPTTPRTTSR